MTHGNGLLDKEERTMNSIEGKELNIKWEQLKLLPDSKEILEMIISDYEWIKQITLTEEEMIQKIERYPLNAKVVEYGIHGLMVSMEMVVGNTRCFWNVYKLEQFKPLL
jgi:hypothetical protein